VHDGRETPSVGRRFQSIHAAVGEVNRAPFAGSGVKKSRYGDGQRVLIDNDWAADLDETDRRALTPLFWSNCNPYGRFEIDLDYRLNLEPAA
jgi:hypothetical protein